MKRRGFSQLGGLASLGGTMLPLGALCMSAGETFALHYGPRTGTGLLITYAVLLRVSIARIGKGKTMKLDDCKNGV